MQLPCPPPNGTIVLKNYGYLKTDDLVFDYGNPPAAMVVFYALCLVVACLGFVLNLRRKNESGRRRGQSNANQP